MTTSNILRPGDQYNKAEYGQQQQLFFGTDFMSIPLQRQIDLHKPIQAVRESTFTVCSTSLETTDIAVSRPPCPQLEKLVLDMISISHKLW
jgi:hypothetical protein